jgi:hypothetical protein
LHEAGVRVDDFTPTDLGARSPLALTAADYAAVLATALAVPELARRLGVDQGWVRRRIARHTLIAVKDGAAWRRLAPAAVPVRRPGPTVSASLDVVGPCLGQCIR